MTEQRVTALSAEEIEEIESELKHYERKSAVAIEALKIVQKYRGWISDQSLREIALYLDMSVDDLDSVATFYNLIYRKPVGKKVIKLCNSVSCWLMGCDNMERAIKNKLDIKLGETTAEGDYTLVPIVCLGACDKAPVMMVNDELHTHLSEEKMDQILTR